MSFSLSLAQRTASLYVDISTGTVGVSNLNASNISISGSSVGIGGGGGAGVLANVGWTPTTTPALTVTLPSGGAFTPSYSNAQHRWIGNDLGYTFSVTGTVAAAPTNTAADYKISVPYPVAVTASYPTDTIVGDLWLSVIYGANSNLFKAYARTLSTDANSLVVRAITGSTDESLGTILAGSVITLQGTATFATTSVNQNTGGALAAGLQTVWIPSTAVNWAPAPAPTFGLPAGAALTYSRNNARYMYVGTDVTYNVDIGGTLTASPTSAASDYTLSIPYPVALTTYTNPTIVGELWLSVVNGVNSNTFKAYARTLTTNANAVTVRLLTGSADESLGALTSGSAFTLQGTMNYTTTSANSNIGIPTAYIAAEFKQDVYGNVGLNTGASNIRAKFDVIQSSNIPALVVDQYGTGDALQVKDGGVTQFVVSGTGNVGIGSNLPSNILHIKKDQNSSTSIIIENKDVGSEARPSIILINDTSNISSIQYNGSGRSAPNSLAFSNNGGNILFGAPIGDIIFTGLSFQTNVVMKNNGNVGIGTTNPLAKLHVNGSINVSGDTVLNGSIVKNNTQDISLYSTTAGNGKIVFSGTPGAAASDVSWIWQGTDGYFYIKTNTGSNGVRLFYNANSWTAVSDIRHKIIIEPISDSLYKINNLRSLIGRFKSDPDNVRRPFLIAQDVEKYFIEAFDGNNKDEYGIRYTDLIPLLVAGIKDLNNELNIEKTKVTDILSRLKTLESLNNINNI